MDYIILEFSCSVFGHDVLNKGQKTMVILMTVHFFKIIWCIKEE